MNDKKIISNVELELYLIGELSPDEMAALDERKAYDDELRGRIEALLASNADIEKRYPMEQMAKRVRNLVAGQKFSAHTASPQRWNVWGIFRVAIPAAVCAVLLLLILPMNLIVPDQILVDDDYREKGTISETVNEEFIEIWRKRDTVAEMLSSGAAAYEGDALQLRYAVSKQCYGVIVSIDGIDSIYIHLSDGQGNAAELAPGDPVWLKKSYILDNAPRYELFYFITSPENFEVEDVKRLLKDAKHPITDLALPVENNITSFTLVKPNGA